MNLFFLIIIIDPQNTKRRFIKNSSYLICVLFLFKIMKKLFKLIFSNKKKTQPQSQTLKKHYLSNQTKI